MPPKASNVRVEPVVRVENGAGDELDNECAALATHRPLSSSFLWFIFIESYKVIPKRHYLGAYG